MGAIYDRIAPLYLERNGTSVTVASYEESLTRFCGLIAGDGPILDLGCGVGMDLRWFHEHDHPAVGIDLSRGQLILAGEIGTGRLLQMEMQHLGFCSEAFAAVWSSASLLHVPKAEAPTVVAEARRVLRSNGLLFVAVKAGEGEAWELGAYGEIRRFFARYSASEIQELLSEHGFSIIECRETELNNEHWLYVLARKGE